MRSRSLVWLGFACSFAGCKFEPHEYRDDDAGARSSVSSTASVNNTVVPATGEASASAPSVAITASAPMPNSSTDAGAADAAPLDEPDAAGPVLSGVMPVDTAPMPPESTCGNGVVEASESCDDANTDGTDGCSAECVKAPDFECPTEGELCVPVVCGDGLLAGDEACDDSNTDQGDGCSQDCATIEPSYACPNAGEPCIDTAACGNGMVEGTEACDEGDANADNGDSCTTICSLPACGDGFVQPGEDCDDGRLSGSYGTCAAGCIWAPRCGDGVTQVGKEECDEGPDGNQGGYGKCGNDCQAAAHCGDGVVDGDFGEECDDGNEADVDGCGRTCRYSANLSVWFDFNENGGSIVHDVRAGNDGEVRVGRRYSSAPPFDEAFQAGGAQGSFIHLDSSFGEVDPTNNTGETNTDPVQFVDLKNLMPNATAATLSIWARRTAVSDERGFLLWMGSDGDGYGGQETGNNLFNPHHEVYILHKEPRDSTSFKLEIGVAASFIYDIDAAEIARPSTTPASAPNCNVSATLTYGAWHHIVVVLENLQNPAGAEQIDPVLTLTPYFNGVTNGPKSGCYSVNLSRFRQAFLGRHEQASNNSAWRGDIDNFMMFNRALTQEEVIEIFENQRP